MKEMGKPSQSEPAILFAGLLYKKAEYLTLAKESLKASFGEVFLETTALPWDYSDYYVDELGSPIARVFLFFKNSFNQEGLPDIKIITNDLEHKLSTEKRRNVNIDPGYLTPSKVVLASTKNYSHRIYMGRGIYAEVTLLFQDGCYRPHLFTYRDYATETYRKIFASARKFLQIKRSQHHQVVPVDHLIGVSVAKELVDL